MLSCSMSDWGSGLISQKWKKWQSIIPHVPLYTCNGSHYHSLLSQKDTEVQHVTLVQKPKNKLIHWVARTHTLKLNWIFPCILQCLVNTLINIFNQQSMISFIKMSRGLPVRKKKCRIKNLFVDFAKPLTVGLQFLLFNKSRLTHLYAIVLKTQNNRRNNVFLFLCPSFELKTGHSMPLLVPKPGNLKAVTQRRHLAPSKTFFPMFGTTGYSLH